MSGMNKGNRGNKGRRNPNVNTLSGYMKEMQVFYSELISRYENELDTLMEGCLINKNLGGHKYFYRQYYDASGRKKQAYIRRKDEEHAVASLCRRRYIEMALVTLRKNKRSIDFFLKRYKSVSLAELADRMGEIHRETFRGDETIRMKCLLEIGDTDVLAWIKEPYERNPLYPEHLIHTTIYGVKVRSKSELNIANMLELAGIPYRYEQRLELGERVFYPDFTILRVWDKKIIYWEHFGMIGEERYEEKMEEKLSFYRKNGITRWDNLIDTYDKDEGELDSQTVMGVIRGILLPAGAPERFAS